MGTPSLVRREVLLIFNWFAKRMGFIPQLLNYSKLVVQSFDFTGELKKGIRPCPFFFVYCRMHFLILGRSVGKRKKQAAISQWNSVSFPERYWKPEETRGCDNSPWEVLGCGGFVVTCISYYSKQILPFHFASGEGDTPLYRLYRYEPSKGMDF